MAETWQKPWRPGTSFLSFSPTNGTRYKGITRDMVESDQQDCLLRCDWRVAPSGGRFRPKMERRRTASSAPIRQLFLAMAREQAFRAAAPSGALAISMTSASLCHQYCKGAEVDFARETRQSDLRGIPSPKRGRARRTSIPTTSLLTACSALPFVQRPANPSPTLKMLFSKTTDSRGSSHAQSDPQVEQLSVLKKLS